MRAEHLGARPPAEEQRFERTQESTRRPPGGPPTVATQLDAALGSFDQLGRDGAQTGAGIAQREAGPLRQVTIVGGPVPGEVTTGEPGERLLPGDGVDTAEPVAREDVGLGAADEGPGTTWPSRLARTKRWTSAWPAVRTPTASNRSRSCSRVKAPSRPSASTMVLTPRVAARSSTPSCWSRRALATRVRGAVSACSHG